VAEMNPYDHQVSSLRANLQRMQQEREVYVRFCACLSSIMLSDGGFANVDGHVAVPIEQLNAVPSLFTVSVVPARVKEGGVEDAPDVEMLVLVVEKKGGENGRLVVPGRPGIVLP